MTTKFSPAKYKVENHVWSIRYRHSFSVEYVRRFSVLLLLLLPHINKDKTAIVQPSGINLRGLNFQPQQSGRRDRKCEIHVSMRMNKTSIGSLWSQLKSDVKVQSAENSWFLARLRDISIDPDIAILRTR